MKKVFISVPMRGRKDEDIQKTINAMTSSFAMAYQTIHGDLVEFIDNFVHGEPESDVKNKAVWYLSKAIEKIADCDILLCLDNYYDFPGCCIEHRLASEYRIMIYELPGNLYAPDLYHRSLAEPVPCCPVSECNCAPSEQ